jgi:hypothetical protein
MPNERAPNVALLPLVALRFLMIATALPAWLGLIVQFPLTMANCLALGMSWPGAVFTYFSFFTIDTNLLTALSLSLVLLLPNSRAGDFLRRGNVSAAIAVYIAMVGGVYSLLLRHIWDPEGLQKLADILLHDAVPLLYVGTWLLLMPKLRLPWKAAISWLAYPLVYAAYVLVRGAITGRYPYPFIDVAKLGYARSLAHFAALLCVFLVAGLVVIAVSRWRAMSRVTGPP